MNSSALFFATHAQNPKSGAGLWHEKMKAVKNPYPATKKKAVGINLSPAVIDYFKKLSDESGVAYQKLIDLYLLDCVKKKKKLSMKWTG